MISYMYGFPISVPEMPFNGCGRRGIKGKYACDCKVGDRCTTENLVVNQELSPYYPTVPANYMYGFPIPGKAVRVT